MNIAEAKVELQKLDRFARAIAKAGEVADAIGSLEDREANLKKSLSELDASITVSRETLARVEAETEARIQAANERAEQAETGARAAGANLIAEAEQRVAALTDAAKVVEGEALGACSAARQEYERIVGQIADKNAELTAIEGRIEKARAQINKILAG